MDGHDLHHVGLGGRPKQPLPYPLGIAVGELTRVAAATSVKLLKNAQENAKANPTLCNSPPAPIAGAIASLGGVTAALASGDLTSLSSLGAALDGLRGLASQQGIDVPEQRTGLNS